MRNRASEWLGNRSKRAWRLGIRIVAGLVALAAIVWLALPFFVSAERLDAALQADLRVRNRVELRAATPPELSLWPSPSLTYRDVSVRQRADGSILFEAERLSAEFDILDAFGGTLAFSNLRLARPRFHLPEDWRDRPPRTGGDFIDMALETAAHMQFGPWPIAQRTFGKVAIRDGVLVSGDEAGSATVISDIDATLSWPDPDEPFWGSVSAEIAGGRVRADLTAPQFRRLIAGGNAPVTITLTLPGASVRADGSASLPSSGFFTGSFTFEAGDVPALLAWYGRAPKGMEAMQTARATARLVASNRTLRFDELSFGVNDTTATGIMDLAMWPGSLPKFTGTLAFQDFDIGDINNLLPLANQFVAERGGERPSPAAAFDIRLSSAQVRIGEVLLGHVAASMLIGQDHALLDIGDSDFEGGRLTGRLSSGPQGIGRDVRLQLSIRDIDLARLGARLGLTELWPSGPGSLDISLGSERPFIDTRRPDLSGKATISANGGRLNRFGAAELRGLAGRAPPFPLAEVGDAGFDYERLDSQLKIEKGAVAVESATLENDTDRLQFSGRVSDADELALTARLLPVTANAAVPLALSIAGPRSAPLVTAIGETP